MATETVQSTVNVKEPAMTKNTKAHANVNSNVNVEVNVKADGNAHDNTSATVVQLSIPHTMLR